MAEFDGHDQAVRPVKRRKFYRKRPEDEDLEPGSVPGAGVQLPPENRKLDPLLDTEANASDTGDGVQDPIHPILSVVQQRKVQQRRRWGIKFTNFPVTASRIDSHILLSGNTSYDKDDVVADVEAVVNRFAPQTGQVADVDKHMMAYIDSELAKRHQNQNNGTSSNSRWGSEGLLEAPSSTDLAVHRQPAALGKLHEIDLGPDATLRNIARTEAAKKRLENGREEVADDNGKVRLRKDGKPWRGRRRRNSDDVKRDQLVEEVLRESRLEIYDEPKDDGGNDDQAADDRLAEQFRREFVDAVQSRRQKNGPATAAKPVKGAKVEDKPKGPKLGGSRSARAAMRELQEKAIKK